MAPFRVHSLIAQEHHLPFLYTTCTEKRMAILYRDAANIGFVQIERIEAEKATQTVVLILEVEAVVDRNHGTVAGIAFEAFRFFWGERNLLGICVGKEDRLVFWQDKDTCLYLIVGIPKDIFGAIGKRGHDGIGVIGRWLCGSWMQGEETQNSASSADKMDMFHVYSPLY